MIPSAESRTLPRVRELKLAGKDARKGDFCRTLPRVRELKRGIIRDLARRILSHPSQGA